MAAYILVAPLHPDQVFALHNLVVLYIGPDQMLPLTSALGAVFGVVLIFWHRLRALVSRVRRALFARRAEPMQPSTDDQ